MSVVLDASAVLAFLKAEPGADVVRQYLSGACLSTVNLLEVLETSQRFEQGLDKTVRLLRGWHVEFVPFDEQQVLAANVIKQQVGTAGVSLADRVCLALAKTRSLPVITADRRWVTLPIELKVILIRGESH